MFESIFSGGWTQKKKIGVLRGRMGYCVVNDVMDVTNSSYKLGKTAGENLLADKVTDELNGDAQEQLLGFNLKKVVPSIALAIPLLTGNTEELGLGLCCYILELVVYYN